MGNKFSTGAKQPGKASKSSGASLFSTKNESAALDESALEAELQAAQNAALHLSQGVDLLSDELRLEQQLAALDDEVVEDDEGALSAGEEDELNLDPEELAELEGELQELEREVLQLGGLAADCEAAAAELLAGGAGEAEATEAAAVEGDGAAESALPAAEEGAADAGVMDAVAGKISGVGAAMNRSAAAAASSPSTCAAAVYEGTAAVGPAATASPTKISASGRPSAGAQRVAAVREAVRECEVSVMEAVGRGGRQSQAEAAEQEEGVGGGGAEDEPAAVAHWG